MRINIWNVVYLVGLVVYITIRGVFGGRSKRAFPSATRERDTVVSRLDALEFVLMGVLTIGNMILPALYLATPWLGFADYAPPALVPSLGAVVMVGALWLFWRAHADLGLNWSITLEMRKNHELIVDGVYRRVRHPMYAAIFLFAIAQGLLLPNWLAGWGGVGSFAILYLVRVPREEKMMLEFFGESYRDYMRRTGRLWPHLGK